MAEPKIGVIRIDRPDIPQLRDDPLARAIYVTFRNGEKREFSTDELGLVQFADLLLSQPLPLRLEALYRDELAEQAVEAIGE